MILLFGAHQAELREMSILQCLSHQITPLLSRTCYTIIAGSLSDFSILLMWKRQEIPTRGRACPPSWYLDITASRYAELKVHLAVVNKVVPRVSVLQYCQVIRVAVPTENIPVSLNQTFYQMLLDAARSMPAGLRKRLMLETLPWTE